MTRPASRTALTVAPATTPPPAPASANRPRLYLASHRRPDAKARRWVDATVPNTAVVAPAVISV